MTWAVDRPAAAQAVWDQAMADAGAPTLPVRRVDTGLDSAGAIERLLVDAGFVPHRVWSHALSRQWDLDSFWAPARRCSASCEPAWKGRGWRTSPGRARSSAP